MDTLQSTPPPVSFTPTVTHTVSPVLKIIASVLVIFAIVISAFVPVQGEYAWKHAVHVIALRGITIAQVGVNPATPYKFGFTGLKAVSSDEVYGKFDTSSDPGVKMSQTVSPDGNFVAYAVQTANTKTSTTTSVSSWHVKLVNLKEKKTTDLGVGVGPQFFTRDGKLWLLSTAVGTVNVTDVDALRSVATPIGLADTILSSAKISPEGTHIALRDPATMRFSIYDVTGITANSSFVIKPTKNTVLTFNDILLSDSAWYGLRLAPNAGGVHIEIHKISYEDPSLDSVLYSFGTTALYTFTSSK
jgi:hypothetical protein